MEAPESIFKPLDSHILVAEFASSEEFASLEFKENEIGFRGIVRDK